ncbi:UN93L-like protein, partial [Mya arenaria]
MSHRRTESSSSATHLSPYDYSGVGMGFGLYRPRRPSYTIATQVQRQRSESYRYAVAKSTADVEDPADFIEGIIQRKNRKDSYIRATRPNERPDVEMRDIKEHMKKVEEESVKTDPPTCPTSPIILINDQGPSEIEISADVYRNHEAGLPTKSNSETRNGKVSSRRASIPNALSNNHLKELKEVVEKKRYSPKHGQDLENHTLPNNFMKGKSEPNQNEEETYDDAVFTCQNEMPDVTTPSSGDTRSFPSPFRSIRIRKNFVLLCVSFILVFNAFRAIQNLQSSLNSTGYLGIISMASIHGTMCLTCLWAPVLINSVTAKWTLVIGVWTHILWIAGNFYPRFYTLIPLGIIAGIGKGIIWTAESSYLVKLSYDYSRVTKEGFEREMFRFHGIFIACFQTTHIFGNLISSLVLHGARNELENPLEESNTDYVVSDKNATYVIYEDYSDVESRKSCGVLFQNKTVFSDLYSDKSKEVPSYLWKMMCAYLGLALVAFIIVMVCLDSIGAKFNPEKTGHE